MGKVIDPICFGDLPVETVFRIMTLSGREYTCRKEIYENKTSAVIVDTDSQCLLEVYDNDWVEVVELPEMHPLIFKMYESKFRDE